MSAEPSVALHAEPLTDWLRSRQVQVSGSVELRRIGLGQSNLTYSITDGAGARWIARRPPLGHLLASAHDVGREFRILSALADTNVPVPGVVGLCEDPAVSDTAVLVVDYVDGLVVDELPIAESLGRRQRHRIGIEMGRVLANLHAVDIEAVGLDSLASHSPYAPRQLKRWSRQWKDSRTREVPALDELTKWLWSHAPAPGDIALVHGDFHIRNLICDPQTGSVRAALDWELSTLGDPLADLGTTLAYWPEPSDPPLGLFAAPQLPGFASRAEIAAEYAVASGRDLGDLAFWQVLGMWKIAIIVEGVRRRAIDEPANAAEGGPPDGSLVDKLVEQAWQVALGQPIGSAT